MAPKYIGCNEKERKVERCKNPIEDRIHHSGGNRNKERVKNKKSTKGTPNNEAYQHNMTRMDGVV